MRTMKTKPNFEKEKCVVLFIGAHPDDIELNCGGLATQFKTNGSDVYFLSVTDGSAGHYKLGREELKDIRMIESQNSAFVIGAHSLNLKERDAELEPSLKVRDKLIKTIRELEPDIIITNRANDYHPDHRYTAQLVNDASYLLIVPAVVPTVPALNYSPLIMYWADNFKNPMPFTPDIIIEVDSVMDKKLEMIACHESQVFEWLPYTYNVLNMVPPKENREGRIRFLNMLYSFLPSHSISTTYKEAVVERYKEEKKECEAYCKSEYGYQCSEDEFKTLFEGL